MPLKNSDSKRAIAYNIKEFHKGFKYKQTEKKFGKKDADKQAIAVAFNQK